MLKKRRLRPYPEMDSFVYTEAYRAFRANVEHIASKRRIKTILVTSPNSGDGKTNTAINLAVALGESGHKVLLVDCDLRKAAVAGMLGIDRRGEGISSLLDGESSGAITWRDTIVRMDTLKISVLPVGYIPLDSAEMLSSLRLAKLLQTLAKQYDYIILDTPPLLSVSDAVTISRYADASIIVARSGMTTKQDLQTCHNRLESVDSQVIGVVLTDSDKRMSKRSRYEYRYGYGKNKSKRKLSKDQTA